MTFQRLAAQRDCLLNVLVHTWLIDHDLDAQVVESSRHSRARSKTAVITAARSLDQRTLWRTWRLARCYLVEYVESHPDHFPPKVWVPVTCPYSIADVLAVERDMPGAPLAPSVVVAPCDAVWIGQTSPSALHAA